MSPNYCTGKGKQCRKNIHIVKEFFQHPGKSCNSVRKSEFDLPNLQQSDGKIGMAGSIYVLKINYDFWKLDRQLTRDDNNNNNSDKIFIATRKAQLQVIIHAGLRTQCMYDK